MKRILLCQVCLESCLGGVSFLMSYLNRLLVGDIHVGKWCSEGAVWERERSTRSETRGCRTKTSTERCKRPMCSSLQWSSEGMESFLYPAVRFEGMLFLDRHFLNLLFVCYLFWNVLQATIFLKQCLISIVGALFFDLKLFGQSNYYSKSKLLH